MLAGQFIVTGPDLPTARVHLLDAFALRDFRDFEALAARKGWAPETWLPRVFEPGVTHAFRCTDTMLQWLVSDAAEGLNVAHRESVRALAAHVLLGEPIPGDGPGDEPRGGQGAKLTPPPVERPPSGGTAAPIPDALRF